MPLAPIFNAGSIGVIKDQPDHILPPEAWTDARGVRFLDGKAQRTYGYEEIFSGASVAPTFLLPIEYEGEAYWIYGSSSKVYVVKGTTHTDISIMGGYSVSSLTGWSGCIFQGIPILNPADATPQYWATINTATALADVPAWTTNLTCKFMASYKNYLVAMNLKDLSGSYPHRVLWSDGAAPGTMPVSWDTSDPSYDADSRDLSDINSGDIVCGRELGSGFSIYKKDSTWLMRYIGGNLIMAVEPVLTASGILGPRAFCAVTPTQNGSDVHFLFNGYDLGIFTGATFVTVIHKKLRRWLLSNIDSLYYENAFCFNNLVYDEAVFAFPSQGQIYPDLCVVWNYRDNTVTIRDFVGLHAAMGPTDTSISDIWSGVSGAWSAQTRVWNSVKRRQIVVADAVLEKFWRQDTGYTAAGTTIPSYLERTGLAVFGQDRTGQPVVNFETRKAFLRVWPKVSGGRMLISLGASDFIGAPPTYNPAQIFDPSLGQLYVDAGGDEPPNGRLLAVKFEGIDNDPWVLDGYTVDAVATGDY